MTSDPKEALERLKSSLSKEFHGLGHMRTSVASDDLRVLIAEREGLEAMHRDMCGVAGRAIERAEAAEAQREGLEREVAQQKHENDRLHEVIAGIISTDAGNRAALEAAESKFSALSDKAENVCIAHGMAWDMEGVIGELRALLDPAVPVEPAQRTETITRVHLPSDVASIPDAYVDVRSPVPPSQGDITDRRAPLVNAMKANLGIGQYDCESEIVGFVDAADAILALGNLQTQPHPDVAGLVEALEQLADSPRNGAVACAHRRIARAALVAFQSRQEEG